MTIMLCKVSQVYVCQIPSGILNQNGTPTIFLVHTPAHSGNVSAVTMGGQHGMTPLRTKTANPIEIIDILTSSPTQRISFLV